MVVLGDGRSTKQTHTIAMFLHFLCSATILILRDSKVKAIYCGPYCN